MEMVSSTLPYTPAAFPCTYLGLSGSSKQFKKAELLLWIERIGDKLPAWKASLMNMAGIVTWVHFVLSAIPIYLLIAIKVPKWFIRSIHKLRRAFTWKGQKQVNRGSCLVAWDKKQQPLDYGGLGILNMEFMGWALQIWWLWLKKIDPNRAWASLDIQVYPYARPCSTLWWRLRSEIGVARFSGQIDGLWAAPYKISHRVWWPRYCRIPAHVAQ